MDKALHHEKFLRRFVVNEAALSAFSAGMVALLTLLLNRVVALVRPQIILCVGLISLLGGGATSSGQINARDNVPVEVTKKKDKRK